MNTESQVRKLWMVAKRRFSARSRTSYTVQRNNVDVLLVDERQGVCRETTLTFPEHSKAKDFLYWTSGIEPKQLGIVVEAARLVRL